MPGRTDDPVVVNDPVTGADVPDVPLVLPAPSLDPSPTGPAPRDSLLTIGRCQRTSWSYSGCEVSFPVQGRRYEEWECRTLPVDQRAIQCARWAEYRIVGVGGPVEREAGIAILDRFCNQDDRVACARLAEVVLFDDLPRARAAMHRGCEVDPDNSPMGLCATLRGTLSDDALRFVATVVSASGLPGITAGGQCRGWVTGGENDSCEGYVECGPHVLWGRGGSFFPCTRSGRAVSGGETMVTAEDGDAAFEIDTTAHTLVVRDDAQGPLGAFELRARVEP